MQNLAQIAVNTVCPICGMPVDEALPGVVAVVTDDEHGDRIHRLGACSVQHQLMLASGPDRFLAAALSNQVVAGAYDDG
jgi:hypothetical protein